MSSRKPNSSAAAPHVFLIAPDDAISAFIDEQEARRAMACGDSMFSSAAELKRLTTDWHGSRLAALWNTIPGVAPIKKFTDRHTALKRIWQALQSVPPSPSSDKPQTQVAKKKDRSGTKKALLLGLLARPEGASLREIMSALGWQAHSVRGCLSTLAKTGVTIHSFHRRDGERAYAKTMPVSEDVQEAAQ